MKRIPARDSLNRWKLARSFALVLLGVLAGGCPAGKDAPEGKPPPGSTAANKVIIKGSNTIGEELGPRLAAEFKKDHAEITFEIEPKATMYGLAALRVGQCDIAAASREAIKEELELARGLGIELKEYIIGAYNVAVVVNAANPLTNLTREQVRDLFTGAIQNWKEVGGPDAPVHLCIRDPISGTYLGFRELAMENKPYASGTKLFTSYAAINEAVAQDPNAIGYSGIDLVKSAGLKAVSIGGIEPSDAAVNKGQYPYARVLRLYTNKAKESSATAEFIKFVVSPRGQEVVAQLGFSPKP